MAEHSQTELPTPQPHSANSPLNTSEQQPDYRQVSEGKQLEQLVSSLPTERGWVGPVCLFENYWCPIKFLPTVLSLRSHFRAYDSDILLASRPKCGTTWLKSLAFSSLRRARFHPSDPGHPLLSSNPHDLVPFLEYNVTNPKQLLDLTDLPTPRLFATHLPYEMLPDSVHGSSCRVIYICRNPLDMIVSFWYFIANCRAEFESGDWPIEEILDYTCRGIDTYGPFWDYVLGYWKKSLERPDKVLFLKYEDLKDDPAGNLKRIANFMGVAFSEEEEKDGVIDEIVKICSLSNMKELEVNKTGAYPLIDKKHFFRKGEIGDWVNYFSPAMAERVHRMMEEKLSPFGLTFKMR